jgi:regulator of protease activity HflC (stomatin/prohibitin superfamily)
MGRFYTILEPGVNILIPFIDRVKYVQSLKEMAIDIPKQAAITSGENSTTFVLVESSLTSAFVFAINRSTYLI